jgi:hypothetical protein
MDMREFLNAPNGLSQPTVPANGKKEDGSPQTPQGGKTVCMIKLLYLLVSSLSVHMIMSFFIFSSVILPFLHYTQ